VLMLGPVVLGFSLLGGSLRAASGQGPANRTRPHLHEIVPWFIVGFLLMLGARSLGLIPASVLPLLTRTAALFTTVAMAALGLGVDIRVVAKTGMRVTLAVTASLIVLALMSYALIRFDGIGGP
jgi:uncharacterized membrane protein YadS